MRYDLESAIDCLKRNKIDFNSSKKVIPRGQNFGLKVQGAVDFLKNYAGFKMIDPNGKI